MQAAQALSRSASTVFKTLVVALDSGELVCTIIASDARLNLNAIASAAGARKADLADPKKAERSTGYVVGGISPFGQRKHLRTLIDASALALDEIVVKGGRRGLQIILEPEDLIAATSAVVVPLRSWMVINRFPRTRAELPDKSIAIESADRSKLEDLRFRAWKGAQPAVEKFPMVSGTLQMKRWLALIAGLAAVMPVFAQTSKPVRLIVGVPPGGTSDTSARIIAPKLAKLLGQQVVVENRPGANNGIATEYVARSAPDGQTVLWAFSGGIVVNPVFYPDVRYDPLKDLVPVDLIGTFQFILVVPRSVPANSIKELLVLAKASGTNEYTYASGGIGSPNHLAGEMLKRAAGVNLRHVPYKGGGPAVVSVLSGETKMYFAGIGSVREHMKSGALKALAVTGPKRASEAPSVPTMQEAGIAGYDVQAWIGALVPAGTSEELVARLHGGLSKVVAMPEIDVRLRREGLEPAGISPQEFGARIKRELAMWDKLIKEAGIKPE